MNNTVKILLGITVGVILLCLIMGVGGLFLFRSAGSVLSRSLETNAGNVAEVSQSIADYELPDGFGQAYAIQVADFSLVSYTGVDDHSHIFLFQLPSNVEFDQTKIESQLQQATESEGKDWVEMQVVERRPVTISGQETTLVISEGFNHQNQPYRQLSVMFTGKGGQAIVVVSGPVASWDQIAVDEFIASIRWLKRTGR